MIKYGIGQQMGLERCFLTEFGVLGMIKGFFLTTRCVLDFYARPCLKQVANTRLKPFLSTPLQLRGGKLEEQPNFFMLSRRLWLSYAAMGQLLVKWTGYYQILKRVKYFITFRLQYPDGRRILGGVFFRKSIFGFLCRNLPQDMQSAFNIKKIWKVVLKRYIWINQDIWLSFNSKKNSFKRARARLIQHINLSDEEHF